MKAKDTTKLKSKPARLSVVEIDRYEVNQLLRRVLRGRHDIRRALIIVEKKDGSGESYSNMVPSDRLWWYEACKKSLFQ